jgi:hypothetical protein
MGKFILLLFIGFFTLSCHHEKTSLSGSEHVELKDFLDAFKKVSLPWRIADTNLMKQSDTTTISAAVFTQFVPDTVILNALGRNALQAAIQPVGKFEKENEIYLLANFIINKKIILETFVFNKKNKYLSHLELLKQGGDDDNYIHSVSITSEPTFIISREKINKQNELVYTRNGYAFNNSANNFIKVVNDSNEDLKRLSEIINPIDTFPRKNKLSGDYAEDKKNFISVRDGSNTSKYVFFIHFEKDDNCIGELKGDMTMRDATHAFYKQSGDPCVIDFTFGTKGIAVKEEGNCGNHRGIKCFFDDTYKKKKETKISTGSKNK